MPVCRLRGQPRQLSVDDRALLETMAAHLAGAIEGLHGAALHRESAVAEERGFLARELHDSIVPALKTTLQKFEHRTGLATHLGIEGNGLPLPADVQVQVLHVVQEALSNVRKHAHALRMHARFEWTCSRRRTGARKCATILRKLNLNSRVQAAVYLAGRSG